MAKARPVWQARLPTGPLPFAFFVSHVREDDEAVMELAAEIRSQSGAGGHPALECFLDVDRWPLGNDILPAIKDSISQSEYLLVWATPAYLRNDRGWVWMELAYAELLERGLNLPGTRRPLPYIVPVFQGVTVRQVSRTPLLNYWHRSLFAGGRKRPIKYLVQKLVAFYQQEARKRASARP